MTTTSWPSTNNVFETTMNAMIIYDKSSRFTGDLEEREVSLPPKLQHILEQPVRDNYQRLDLNE
jgi:hypothetical protein